MKPDISNKPRIPQGWLRVLLFVVFYLSLLVISGFILGRFGQKPSPTTGDGTTTTTAIPYGLFIFQGIISVAAVWLFRTQIDRLSFTSIGFIFNKNGSHAAAGFFLGVLLLCSGTCILYFSKNLVWTDISFNGIDLFISFGLMLIIAVYEEIVFRGYILNNLMESAGKWPALLLSAFIFAVAHVTNPDFSIVGAINIFLAGILLGINYIYTKNLWFGIMLHFTWNFFQGPILGYDVSGMHLRSLFQHDIQGNQLLTGAKFGFEGSLVATLLCLITVIALIWVYEKKYTSWPVAENNLPVKL